jgi:DNA-binding NtrC family response regulator
VASDGRDFTDGATDLASGEWPATGAVRRFELRLVDGPSAGRCWESSGDRSAIGSHPSNDLAIDDPTVSRFHCEILMDARGARVRDLGSKNGTILDGVPVVDGYLRAGSVLRLGHQSVSFSPGVEVNHLPLSESTSFGSLVGASPSMRAAFALLERAAATDATVLLEGETGTGKEGAAEGLHEQGTRRGRPFVIVDCAAIPEHLLESELFGHERGAFTGAASRHIGAFEEASGGTVFLDEIGELPLELQPKLLRALEQRAVRRVGGNGYQSVDVRVVAATNRDLRAEVNAGRFRADLYFRLAVVKITLPPLRSRPEDIPILVGRILASLIDRPGNASALTSEPFLATLRSAAWPGNVRELRNYLERCLVFREPAPLEPRAATGTPDSIDPEMRYEVARQHALARFERAYVEALLRRHDGNVTRAAQAAGVGRGYLHRLIRRHGGRE